MALGIKLGLGPGDFVLDGDPAAPPQKGGGVHQIWTVVIGIFRFKFYCSLHSIFRKKLNRTQPVPI